MAAPAPAGHSDDIDELDAFMDRLDAASLGSNGNAPKNQPRTAMTRPLSSAFPTRSSSRNSSTSRLSTKLSTRSFTSLSSTSTSTQGHVRSEDDDDVTPSVQQGEWAQRQRGLSATHTTNATAVPTIPTRSSSRKHRPPPLRDDASNSRSIWSFGSPDSSTKSVPTTPKSLTHRQSPSSSSSLHPPTVPGTASPNRLMPRSPLSDRTPLDDLAFLKDLNEWAEGDRDSIRSGGTGSSYPRRPGPASSANVPSAPPANLRAQRLREDIERAARKLRSPDSNGSNGSVKSPSPASSSPLPPDATANSPMPPSPLPPVSLFSSSNQASPAPSDLDMFRPQLDTRSSSSSSGAGGPAIVQSGLPLFPGASLSYSSLKSTLDEQQPASTTTTSSISLTKDDETRSLASFRSQESIKPLVSGLWHPSSNQTTTAMSRIGGPMRTVAEPGVARDLREWTQGLMVWHNEAAFGEGKNGGSSTSSSSKNPFMREVPAAVKRKMGSSKRESSQLFSATEALMFGLDDTSKVKSTSSSSSTRESHKDRDKSKNVDGGILGKDGSWRRAVGVLRDDGYFRVFAEDKSIMYSVHLPSLNRTDIRPVDRSVFDKPNCIVIYRKKGSAVTPFTTSYSYTPNVANGSSTRPTSEEPVFVRMPSIVAMQTWLVMAHCFAKPEFYLSTGATTPRPMRRPEPGFDGDEESSRVNGTNDDTRCRVYRSLYVSINEGKNIGRAAVEIIRSGARPSLEATHRSASSLDFDASSIADISPTKSTGASGLSKLTSMTFGSDKTSDDIDTFCEIVLDGDVIARTSLRTKTNCPFWNESFTFCDLPPFTDPLALRLYQTHKNSKPSLLGTCTIRLPDLPRAELIESWCSIRGPSWQGSSTATVGELSLGIKVNEEIVLPSQEYSSMLQMMRDDTEAQLPQEIAHEFPSSLEELSRLLLRIYQADNLVLPRIFKLAETEVGTNTKTAAILFRGNTVLTKTVELFMRLVGSEYLEASIGEPVRKICRDKVAIEIDPSKMKAGVKEKEITHNLHELHEWSIIFWNAIHDARSQCPEDLRRIFAHIQDVVVSKYGVEQKNIKWTSVGAFVFLRFFVPAILNPRLFGIVNAPPDAKIQRTLTLIAKTLQGLANFSSFGQKEPWMVGMNVFLQDHTSAYVDFIEHIATPESSRSTVLDWTSPDCPTYLAPARLRSTLPPLIREGVPVLPHLIDLPKEFGMLAAFVSRGIVDKGPPASTSIGGDRSSSPAPGGRTGRSPKFAELAEVCVDVQEEARRRGRPLYAARSLDVPTLGPPMLGSGMRARSPTAGSTSDINPERPSHRQHVFVADAFPTTPPRTRDTAPTGADMTPTSTDDILHIRADDILHIRPQPETPPGPVMTDVSSPLSDKSSVASRKSHRSVVINGVSPRRGSLPGGANIGMGRPSSPETTYNSRSLPPPPIPAPDFSTFSHFSAIPLSAASTPAMGNGSPRMSFQPTAALTERDLTAIGEVDDGASFRSSPFATSRRGTKSSLPPVDLKKHSPQNMSIHTFASDASTTNWTLLPNEADALAANPPLDPSNFGTGAGGATGLLQQTSSAMQPSKSTSSWASTTSHRSSSAVSSAAGHAGTHSGGERGFFKSLFSGSGNASNGGDTSNDSSSVKSAGRHRKLHSHGRSGPHYGQNDTDVGQERRSDAHALASPPATTGASSARQAHHLRPISTSSANSSDSISLATATPHMMSPGPAPLRSPMTYTAPMASPCFVHSHLDNSLSDIAKRDAAAAAAAAINNNSHYSNNSAMQSFSSAFANTQPKRKPRTKTVKLETRDSTAAATKSDSAVTDGESTANEAESNGIRGDADEDEIDDDDDDESAHPSLTRQLAETAVSVREMSKQLGRARVVSPVQSVLIITKARDNHLIRLTRELALWLMTTHRKGRDRGIVVYVDHQLKRSKRFDAEGLERDYPELFRPLPRRYSRTSSSASLAGGGNLLDHGLKKMTQLTHLNEVLRRTSLGSEQGRRTPDPNCPEEGQLRYWTNDMCTRSPQLFDFVITLGGDGTVLYASWLFQRVVPPVLPFALGSLGFLTNFDFSNYADTLNNAIDNGVRVNLRMRFTCTVYRAVEEPDLKKRRAVRSGRTGGIFMKSLNRDGWEIIESGGQEQAMRSGNKGKCRDKEIKCFVTRPVESFEVLNDLVVDRGPSPYVSQLELFGDEHHMTTVQADGLTVSTPTGSTAYSLSAGGSLVHPEVPALLVTPICPHTLSFRPMLVPDSMELRICVPYNSRSTAWASFDGRGRVELRQGDHIKVTASQYPFPTVCADNQSNDWFNSIARTLKWNERERQKSFVVVEEGRNKPMSRQNSVASKTSPTGHESHRMPHTLGEEDDEDDAEDEEDELDDDSAIEGEEDEEDETYDIDDLSSNPTNASSPSTSAHDPTSAVPMMSHETMSMAQQPTHRTFHKPARPTWLGDVSAASSVAELNDDQRFKDPAPRPPRLSARHSHQSVQTMSSLQRDKAAASGSAASTRGLDNLSAALSSPSPKQERTGRSQSPYLKSDTTTATTNSTAGGRRSRNASPRAMRAVAESTDAMSSGYAFAVVGADSDTSLHVTVDAQLVMTSFNNNVSVKMNAHESIYGFSPPTVVTRGSMFFVPSGRGSTLRSKHNANQTQLRRRQLPQIPRNDHQTSAVGCSDNLTRPVISWPFEIRSSQPSPARVSQFQIEPESLNWSREDSSDGTSAAYDQLSSTLRDSLMFDRSRSVRAGIEEVTQTPSSAQFDYDTELFNQQTTRVALSVRSKVLVHGGFWDLLAARAGRSTFKAAKAKPKEVLRAFETITPNSGAAVFDSRKGPTFKVGQIHDDTRKWGEDQDKENRRVSIDMIGPPEQFRHLVHASDDEQASLLLKRWHLDGLGKIGNQAWAAPIKEEARIKARAQGVAEVQTHRDEDLAGHQATLRVVNGLSQITASTESSRHSPLPSPSIAAKTASPAKWNATGTTKFSRTLSRPAGVLPPSLSFDQPGLLAAASSLPLSPAFSDSSILALDTTDADENDNMFRPRNFTPSLTTVEKAAATKIFLETKYYGLLKRPPGRQQRRLQLERELSKLNISDQQRNEARQAWQLGESEYLRELRARVDVESFVKLKTIGHGAFGVVSLVRERKSGELYAMKQIRKADMLRKQQEAHIKAERDLLAEASSTTRWIVPLAYSFQDSENLYLVLSYMCGGDMLSLLIERDTFSESMAKFYISELLLAISETHRVLGAIHRDIKPDNILISASGHIQISDFGLATDFHWAHDAAYYEHQRMELLRRYGIDVDDGDQAKTSKCSAFDELDRGSPRPLSTDDEPKSILTIRDRNRRKMAYSVVGTNNYMAVEVVRGLGYDQSCDWWSLGIILQVLIDLFEMLYGYPPFVSKNRQQTRQKILSWRSTLRFPTSPRISREAQDLICGLICEKEDRLGSNMRTSRSGPSSIVESERHRQRSGTLNGKGVEHDGTEDIMVHPFFRNVDFHQLHLQTPPFVPEISAPDDTRYFDDDIEDATLPPADHIPGMPPPSTTATKDPLLGHSQHGATLLELRKQMAFQGWTFKRPHKKDWYEINQIQNQTLQDLATTTLKSFEGISSDTRRGLSV
ncbi:hypothetical protein OIO90_002206 [Microbotryomycetes sp. JL221]|nr:hypothetical protein OIO90_002206 [Microbotryomycetes sp. JL221]